MAPIREHADALRHVCEIALASPVKADPPGDPTVNLAKQILAAAQIETEDAILKSCSLKGDAPGWGDILSVMRAIIAATPR